MRDFCIALYDIEIGEDIQLLKSWPNSIKYKRYAIFLIILVTSLREFDFEYSNYIVNAAYDIHLQIIRNFTITNMAFCTEKIC